MEVACSAYHYKNYLDLDSFFVCLIIACLDGSYMLCMLLTVPKVLQSVEYLHYMSYRHLFP